MNKGLTKFFLEVPFYSFCILICKIKLSVRFMPTDQEYTFIKLHLKNLTT